MMQQPPDPRHPGTPHEVTDQDRAIDVLHSYLIQLELLDAIRFTFRHWYAWCGSTLPLQWPRLIWSWFRIPIASILMLEDPEVFVAYVAASWPRMDRWTRTALFTWRIGIPGSPVTLTEAQVMARFKEVLLGELGQGQDRAMRALYLLGLVIKKKKVKLTLSRPEMTQFLEGCLNQDLHPMFGELLNLAARHGVEVDAPGWMTRYLEACIDQNRNSSFFQLLRKTKANEQLMGVDLGVDLLSVPGTQRWARARRELGEWRERLRDQRGAGASKTTGKGKTKKKSKV